MTCSLLWVRCLCDRLLISDFGGKWPLKWKFSKMSFQISWRDTKLRFVTKFGKNRPLQSCRKVAWITTQKKLMLCVTRPSLIFAQNWPYRAQNSLNVVTPWHVQVYRIWSGSAVLCRIYSGKIDFRPKKSIQYRLSAYNDNTYCWPLANYLHIHVSKQYVKNFKNIPQI